MAAAETRSSGCDTVNCRAREIRTDSIRLVASRKLQSSIFGAVSTPHQAGTSRSPPLLSTDNEHVLSPLGRCGLFVFNSSFAGMNQDHRSPHPHHALPRTADSVPKLHKDESEKCCQQETFAKQHATARSNTAPPSSRGHGFDFLNSFCATG